MDKPSLQYRLFQWAVFTAGDIRFISKAKHGITYNEVALDAAPLLKKGDVVLHRDKFYLSNFFIGGCMIHAGIYVGFEQIVEAISEGVVQRHVMNILRSDYACILRPRLPIGVKDRAINDAVKRAKQIIGSPYDPMFNFNGKEELELLKNKQKSAEFKFCCTEIPYVCYYEYLDLLNVYRRRNISLLTKALSLIGLKPGKAVVDADIYFNGNFDLVWASKSMTEKWAQKRAEENFVRKLGKYVAGKPQRPSDLFVDSGAKVDL